MYQEYHEHTNITKAGDILVYHVKPGDNVYRIARMLNSKIEWIACLNELNQQMIIYPGQNLLVPVLFQEKPQIRPGVNYDMYF